MKDKEKPEKVTMVTTHDIYSDSRKSKKDKPILTTHDLPDVLPIQKDYEESTLKGAITTSDVKEKRENEEQKSSKP